MVSSRLCFTAGVTALGLIVAVAAPAAAVPPDPRTDPVAFMRFAIAEACEKPVPEGRTAGPALAGRFGDATLLEERVFEFRGRPGRTRYGLLLANGDEVRLERLFPTGRLRRVTLEYHRQVAKDRVRPVISAAVGADCRVIRAARIDYDATGAAETLVRLGPDLEKDLGREPLNPPVPKRRDPGGVVVAQVDTGVNYLLDFVGPRLARDGDGGVLGFDFWDMDAWPFDVDTARSAFFPLHHGTAVASILLREAPTARLIPYRYPRPEMARMADLVADADKKGAVIVNMAMGSNKRQDWDALAQAAAERPHMLFIISAGNNGRDIDRTPVYPAALDLENFLVVTSADDFGRLADGSNWGREHVDIMVPGERIPVIDHRGAQGRASGSSFAVPRVAALAARLLANNPDWRAPALKNAIVARARPSRHYETLPVRFGWIPDPTDDF